MVLAAETADEPQFFSIQLRDTTHEARREGLEKAKVAIRDRIEQGQPLKGTLDEVVLLIESQLDWALGVVMRVRAGVLELAAGDRVPPLLAGTLRSVAVDPSGAPCSRAAARNEPVVLTDVSASPAPARLPGLSAARSARVVLVARLGSERLRRRNGRRTAHAAGAVASVRAGRHGQLPRSSLPRPWRPRALPRPSCPSTAPRSRCDE